MKVRLELVHKKAKTKKVWLKADTVIGRSAECGLRIASSEVSRQHCKICLADDGVTVRDLGSSNGTFINGYQLEPETDYEIAPNSELSIGGVKFFVRFTEPAAKAMQNNGLGSTVDLEPEHPEIPEIAESAVKAEDRPAAEADETPDAPEPVPHSETETISAARPEDGVSATEEPDFEISTHGDSAVLEREDGKPEANEPAVDRQAEEAPETKEVPYDRLMAEAKKSGPGAPQSQAQDEKSKPDDEEATVFIEPAVEEDPQIPSDDESLGDFFKQFD